MQAIEFTTASENGVIKIPANYGDWYSKPLKVILLTDAEDAGNPTKTDLYEFFDQFQADLTNYHFNREEIHER